MSLLLATVIEYVIKFIAFAAIITLAVFCGINLRKLSDKKKAEKEEARIKAASEAEITDKKED